MPAATVSALLERFREGKPAALARAISMVEDEREGFQDFLHRVLARGPAARRVGLTGPPGAGKSSLLAAVANAYRGRGDRVGVVAVDPTSPYSGGALLGDRIRMNDLATDPGIFIRSMASRGSLGGLATTTKEVLDLMDRFGFEHVLVETVGVGQTELEITSAADTVVVVLVPESGDAIQAMKAGLMEIADVFVVNKADRPGAARLVKEIRQALHLRAGSALKDVPAHHGVDLRGVAKGEDAAVPAAKSAAWEIPVLTTNALTSDGLDELLTAIDAHREWLEGSGALADRRRDRARRRIRDVVERELRRVAWSSPDTASRLDSGLDRIQAGEATPYSVGREITDALLR
ncbi:MAG TPA: methylmalonyl Co-A mutase-associated GTPase MeaB [Longimicrobiales bacterium]|nr:methylmalonyl Co-A mutase-associated GTPase MeaB [Longimicrobiales bacterium]